MSCDTRSEGPVNIFDKNTKRIHSNETNELEVDLSLTDVSSQEDNHEINQSIQCIEIPILEFKTYQNSKKKLKRVNTVDLLRKRREIKQVKKEEFVEFLEFRKNSNTSGSNVTNNSKNHNVSLNPNLYHFNYDDF